MHLDSFISELIVDLGYLVNGDDTALFFSFSNSFLIFIKYWSKSSFVFPYDFNLKHKSLLYGTESANDSKSFVYSAKSSLAFLALITSLSETNAFSLILLSISLSSSRKISISSCVTFWFVIDFSNVDLCFWWYDLSDTKYCLNLSASSNSLLRISYK